MENVTVSSDAQRLADAALSLVGLPFRMHGRDPATGVDCVGVAIAAVERTGRHIDVPADYRLRGGLLTRFDQCALSCGLALVPALGVGRSGDIILCQPAPQQFHIMVDAGDVLVHAHAGLRRVVAIPQPVPWPVLRRWRLQAEG
jgi:hypothetical protein